MEERNGYTYNTCQTTKSFLKLEPGNKYQMPDCVPVYEQMDLLFPGHRSKLTFVNGDAQ